MRLASQREKLEDEKENMDRLAEQELMAYQVARESLGEEAAYSIEMDNPLPAARMKQIPVAATRSKFMLKLLTIIQILPVNFTY